MCARFVFTVVCGLGKFSCGAQPIGWLQRETQSWPPHFTGISQRKAKSCTWWMLMPSTLDIFFIFFMRSCSDTMLPASAVFLSVLVFECRGGRLGGLCGRRREFRLSFRFFEPRHQVAASDDVFSSNVSWPILF